MNTVHVHDVVRAAWHVCRHGNSGEIYNLADKGNTCKSTLTLFSRLNMYVCVCFIFGTFAM